MLSLESERNRALPTPKVLGNRNRGYIWASYIPWVPLEVAHAPLGRYCDFQFSGFGSRIFRRFKGFIAECVRRAQVWRI